MKVHSTGMNNYFRHALECCDSVLCSMLVTPALMVRISHLRRAMVYEIVHMQLSLPAVS